jgi:hypothetical protein
VSVSISESRAFLHCFATETKYSCHDVLSKDNKDGFPDKVIEKFNRAILIPTKIKYLNETCDSQNGAKS